VTGGDGLYVGLWVRVSGKGSMRPETSRWVKQETGRIMPEEMME
jgi:hypothetical protein